jgi:hypothetical protein
MDYLVYYESYVRMKIYDDKGVRLYKVCHAGNKLLDKPQEVDKALHRLHPAVRSRRILRRQLRGPRSARAER